MVSVRNYPIHVGMECMEMVSFCVCGKGDNVRDSVGKSKVDCCPTFLVISVVFSNVQHCIICVFPETREKKVKCRYHPALGRPELGVSTTTITGYSHQLSHDYQGWRVENSSNFVTTLWTILTQCLELDILGVIIRFSGTSSWIRGAQKTFS